ncbi:hypothetical protein D5039_05075 [Verminephrobacter aporrectodeae subsp. tuberculatae]|uniref:Uncharacterized protein n=1 Tax=Verminephrobacter aporrectodeae subsp. tuberculatae TaxID=1110392 RepID=A0ABT3KQH8_9BURK|nr:hypothetical protein [Verminephrobacter aporrectodeae]MCW5320577.1 hypothetical protein [Verminephrobacter aporrectodeae subsp. tuberculatae]
MQATIQTVNATGLQEIHTFLAENHRLGGDHFNPAMLRAWAAQAEHHIAQGNGASIELDARDSVHGVTQVFDISEAGIDTEHVEIEE